MRHTAQHSRIEGGGWDGCRGMVDKARGTGLLDVQHPSRDVMMPVPQLVVLGPYDFGVDFGHPDVKDAKTERRREKEIHVIFFINAIKKIK